MTDLNVAAHRAAAMPRACVTTVISAGHPAGAVISPLSEAAAQPAPIPQPDPAPAVDLGIDDED